MRIGFCNGCFDRFHSGHRYFLSEARMLCDYLVIGVNSDDSVSKLKGPERPYWPLFIRLEHVNDFGQGIPFDGRVVHLLKAIRPDILIRGEDQSDEGIQYAKDFHRIVRIPGYSTSALAS